MPLLNTLKKAFSRWTPTGSLASDSPKPTTPEQLKQAPEVSAAELMAEVAATDEHKPLLLDCREDFERRQSFIPNSLHIAMNTIPYRVSELDHSQDIVVYCAHGNRSYSVAGWLIQQGYTARSLTGGITDWQARGGPTESLYRSS